MNQPDVHYTVPRVLHLFLLSSYYFPLVSWLNGFRSGLRVPPPQRISRISVCLAISAVNQSAEPAPGVLHLFHAPSPPPAPLRITQHVEESQRTSTLNGSSSNKTLHRPKSPNWGGWRLMTSPCQGEAVTSQIETCFPAAAQQKKKRKRKPQWKKEEEETTRKRIKKKIKRRVCCQLIPIGD